jgi:hypothetical protein
MALRANFFTSATARGARLLKVLHEDQSVSEGYRIGRLQRLPNLRLHLQGSLSL